MRVLGRDETQKRAIAEALALPVDHPHRRILVQLLTRWGVNIPVMSTDDYTHLILQFPCEELLAQFSSSEA
jgi:hypothetical protein